MKDRILTVILWAISTALVSFLFMAFGAGLEGGRIKDEAVEVGHAEYYLDEDHNKQWRWLPVGDKEITP